MKSMADFNKQAQREERKEGSQRQKIIVKPVSPRRGCSPLGHRRTAEPQQRHVELNKTNQPTKDKRTERHA